MCSVHKVAAALLFIGGLNWGLVGAFGPDYNLVNYLLDSYPAVESLVYVLVGLSALFMLGLSKCCGKCQNCGSAVCKCN